MSQKKEQGFIKSGNFELGYVIEGRGKPALVIGSSIYYPRTFSAPLRESLKLIFVDHRGFAPTSADVAVSEFAFDIILDDIELVRSRLGLKEVTIIGHSGHGYMALEYAKKYPQNVDRVVMIGTGPSHSQFHKELGEQYWNEAVCPDRKKKLELDLELLPAEISAAPERRFITFCIRLGARSWYDYNYDATPLWKDVHVNMPAFDYLWGEVFRDIDVAKGLEKLDRPVFLALGRFDSLVAPYSTWDAYRKKFRDLTVRVFDQSGHTPQLEESELFESELLKWMRDTRSGK